jgi:LPXTG-motif cell wall-anchored protein
MVLGLQASRALGRSAVVLGVQDAAGVTSGSVADALPATGAPAGLLLLSGLALLSLLLGGVLLARGKEQTA